MDPRYPIGVFEAPAELNPELLTTWINTLQEAPAQFRALTSQLNDCQLDTPYREGGWTLRQVVHHVADSHMQSYTRFKLALTETEPTIKPYDEGAWAEQEDYQLPVEVSLVLLESLHTRWVRLMESLTPEQWHLTFRHPESGVLPLWKVLGLYDWHSRHHLAHIRQGLQLQS